MTKQELITALAEMPDDAEVFVEDTSGTLVPAEVERHEGASGLFTDGFIVVAFVVPAVAG